MTSTYEDSQARLAASSRQLAEQARANGDHDRAQELLQRARWAETHTVAPVGYQLSDDRRLYS